MKRTAITLVAAAAAFLLFLFAAGIAIGTAAFASPADSAEGSEAESSKLKISDAALTWGINAESGSGAYLPGSCNFLSAGVAGDNGGSSLWPNDAEKRGLFKAKDGNVEILRPTADGGTQPITWDNKCQTPEGKRVNTSGVNSGNYVQFSGGKGEVDTAANTGTIQWEGSFTLVYYSGYTYWSVSNPKLEVKNGKGKLTGTFSGYGTDMEDLSKWEKLNPVEGTIADFENNKVELDENGFTVTPDYEGIDSGQPDQNKEKEGWGSFPKSWVDFNVLTGQTQYWYTSGGAADVRKKPSPLSVSFTGTPIVPEQPPTDSQQPKPKPDTGGDSKEKPGGTSSEEKKPSKTPKGSDATLFWAINKESSAGGFAPGTCNFLSAGVSPDNGGAVVWDAPGKLYKPSDGNVKIEKPDASGKFHTATWQNKCDDRYGGRVVAADKNSHHESRLNMGAGSIDFEDGGITASWEGGFTIVFYSGMTYWSVADPKLTVTKDGKGELTGTASGYGADMEDLSKWEKLKSETITLATFSGLDVDKAVKDGGFTVTPDYQGVEYEAGGGLTPQDRTGSEWGSFPKSFVDFNVKTGQSSYWYSSGGIADARKPALPLTVAFDNSFEPPASEPAKPGQSAAGAGGAAGTGSTVPGGSTVGGPGAAGSGGGPGALPQSPNAQPADVEDKTAFAATAAEARRSEGMGSISAKSWGLGGATAAAGIAATVGIGWLLRRSIGLDPSTWT